MGNAMSSEKNKKERTIGSIIMRIRKEVMEKERRIITEKEGMIVRKVKLEK